MCPPQREAAAAGASSDGTQELRKQVQKAGSQRKRTLLLEPAGQGLGVGDVWEEPRLAAAAVALLGEAEQEIVPAQGRVGGTFEA